MDSNHSEKPFQLLDLPAELRDMVYEHVLFASAWTSDTDQRRENLKKGVPIHTNILLTSRLVFEEARNMIINAQLIEVRLSGPKPESLQSAAATEDGVPMFHSRYTKFCLLRHNIMEHFLVTPWNVNRDDSICIIRKEDVFRFCGGIRGLDSNRYVPQMLCPRMSHDLELFNPRNRLPPDPDKVSIRVPTHDRLLKEYQMALAGCKDFWIYAHSSLEPDNGIGLFMVKTIEKIMSSNPSRIWSRNGRLANEGEDDAEQDFQGIFII